MARSQKDVLEEIFATEERDGTINFSVNGAYQDSFEVRQLVNNRMKSGIHV